MAVYKSTNKQIIECNDCKTKKDVLLVKHIPYGMGRWQELIKPKYMCINCMTKEGQKLYEQVSNMPDRKPSIVRRT